MRRVERGQAKSDEKERTGAAGEGQPEAGGGPGGRLDEGAGARNCTANRRRDGWCQEGVGHEEPGQKERRQEGRRARKDHQGRAPQDPGPRRGVEVGSPVTGRAPIRTVITIGRLGSGREGPRHRRCRGATGGGIDAVVR